MLEDMRHAGRILRRCPETDIEYLVVIFRGHKGHSRAGLPVAQKKAVTARVFQVLVLDKVIFFQNTVRNFHKILTVLLISYSIFNSISVLIDNIADLFP